MGQVSLRIVIVEDHPLFRQVLSDILDGEDGLVLGGAVASAEECLAHLDRDPADIVVLDLNLPGMGGRELLGELNRRGAGARCLVLSGDVAPDVVYEVVELGAAGVLSKSADRREVVRAIRTVAEGGTVLGDDTQAGLADQIRQRRVEPAVVLTERERAILELVAAGRTNEEIGRQVHLSPATVKTHLRHVFDKLGAADRASAVAEGMRRGIIG